MKNFFLFIIFLSCGIVGIMLKRYHKKRKNFYSEILLFLRKLKEEIGFKKNFFKDVKKQISHSGELENIIIGKISPDCVLNAEEQKELHAYFKDVGTASLSYEIENVDKAISYVEEKYKETREGYKKKGNLSVKLGFLTGVGIVILLI